jgi:Ca2+-binding RTX toxin-like protein
MSVIDGTSGNDNLTGTPDDDQINAGDGFNDVSGNAGNDSIVGGNGEDRLNGDDGNDTLLGGAGSDQLNGGDGSDSVDGGPGDDNVGGGLGQDTVHGGEGNDTIFFPSYLTYGDGGNDYFSIGNGQGFTVFGGDGDDTFNIFYASQNFAPAGTLTLVGGAGRDLFVLLDPAFNSPSGFADTNVLLDFQAGPGGDIINIDALLQNSGQYGYTGGNPFDSDFVQLVPNGGTDWLLQYDQDGSGGLTTWQTALVLSNVTGSFSADNFAGGIPPGGGTVPGDTLTGTAGNDSLQGRFFDDSILGGDGNDTLVGQGGNDVLRGGIGDDSIVGGPGDDMLFGEAGNDTFVVSGTGTGTVASGGAGSDLYRLDLNFLTSSRGFSVTDFDVANDLIDVYPLLLRSAIPYGTLPLQLYYTGGNPFEQGYLQWVPSGDGIALQWDIDGPSGGQATWQTVLTLANVSSVGSLSASNFVGNIDPSGASGSGAAFTGTAGADSLYGSIYDDTVTGLAGNDSLVGSAGNDVVNGDEGNDTLVGSLGNDTIYGGDGTDWLFRNTETAEDIGDDWIYGGAGHDEIQDNVGNNHLFGDDGDDTFKLHWGIIGFEPSSGSSTITGGAGRDSYFFASSGVPNLAPPNFTDVITDFQAGAGGDIIGPPGLSIPNELRFHTFELGYFQLLQQGNDVLFQVDIDAGGSNFGWRTIVTLLNVNAADFTSDNFTGQLIIGTAGNDSLVGGFGIDTIQGLGGRDTLDGGSGGDQMEGGSGADFYYVDNAADVVLETSNGPEGGGLRLFDLDLGSIIDEILATVDRTLEEFVENLTFLGVANLNGTGNSLNNVMLGNGGANRLEGLGGNDLIRGELGADTLGGGQGLDTIDGGAGDDWILGGRGSDSILGLAGADHLEGSPGDDMLEGGTGNDSMYGGQGVDVLYGNRGGDLLDGGLGADSVYGAPGADLLIGGTGGDYLEANFGIDTLNGGAGDDTMSGGGGIDRFVYTSTSLGTGDVTAGGHDQIVATSGDLLDLQLLLANTVDEIAVVGTTIQIDVNNDGTFNALQDFQITITGIGTINFDSGDSLFHLTA